MPSPPDAAPLTPWYDLKKLPWFERALWICGPTGSGKSTLARQIAEGRICRVVECGQFARALCSPNATAAELSAMSLSLLEKDHRYFAKMIGEHIEACRTANRLPEGAESIDDANRFVIVGARNPTDFVELFDPKKDGIAYLEGPVTNQTQFESMGLAAILSYVRFLYQTDIVRHFQYAHLPRLPEARAHGVR